MKATPKEIRAIEDKGVAFKTIARLHRIWQVQLKRINHKQTLKTIN